MKAKLVVFDLDGTLVRIPLNYSKLREAMGIGSEYILSFLRRVDEETRQMAFRLWDELEIEVLEGVSLVEEGKAVYDQSIDVFKALVTMQGRKIVEAIMGRYGLSFDVIVSREDSLDRVEQLRIVFSTMGVKPEEALFVGDRVSDFESARKVCCCFRNVG